MNIQKLHNRSMDLLEGCELADRRGHKKKARRLLKEASDLEVLAAQQAVESGATEPSRSILLRSAATLSLRCGQLREAERQIALALGGDPPKEIADELRTLLDEVNFSRHLELRGIELQPDEMQLSIAGDAIGHGVAPSDEVIRRIEAVQKLLHRTAENIDGREFRERGGPRKDIRADFGFFLSTPRAASFAVTIRIGRSKDQQELDCSPAQEVIDTLFRRLECFDNANEDNLRQLIPKETYFVNFMSLARELSPQAPSVKIVGLTNSRGGQERTVQIRRERQDARTRVPLADVREKATQHQLQGTVRFADSVDPSHNTIKVVTSDGKQHKVHVPPGLMNDIVRPLWDEEVRIEVRSGRGGSLHLLEIERVAD